LPKSNNHIKAYWNFLIGDTKYFSLESRVFHSFSIIVILICVIEVLINIIIHFYESAIICVIVFLVQGSIFFLSRIRNNLRVAILLTGFECNIFLGITYFINGGSKGPIMLFFISTLFLMSSISKVKQVKFWVLLNVFTAVSIGIIEYYFPQSIINTYSSRRDLFIDNISTYVVCVVLVSLGIYYIKSAYSKQSKRLKENSTQLVNSNKEKDKLFSIISHDVKAPLNAIKQYLEFLSEGLLTPQEKSYMEGELLKTTISTQNLLENLLEWSRIQIDGGPISIEYLNLSETLKGTVENTKIMCAKKSIIFITDINKEVICFTNSFMIQLIVRNLLNNAIKFTPKEGLIHIGIIVEDKQCKIYIKDNGVGIADDKKDEIFSLNVKSTAGTENESGTGLGLVLCKEYMDKLSGEITFESEPSLGTTFYVTLPYKKLA
jgi:two-component system sensor histidine kinase/response regulator